PAPRSEGDGGERTETAGEGGVPVSVPATSEETITFEGGGDFGDDEGEPNFNREDANRETVGAGGGGGGRHDRPRHGGGGGGGGRRHGGRGGRGRGPRGGGDRGPRGGGGGGNR